MIPFSSVADATDIRREATAERTAARKSGAPIGPRIRPVIHFDEEGMFTVWPDKACSVCAVGLTSRNRYENKTLCIEHGKEHQRNRVRKPQASASAQASAAATVRKEQSPEHARLYRCFNAWVRNPSNDDHCQAMRQAMDSHELNERIKRAIPPTDGA